MGDILAFPGLRTSSKQNNYFRRQYFAKYISNLIGFNENLDFKGNFNVAFLVIFDKIIIKFNF